MAKIGIDARLWGTKNTGIGRYTEELVGNLQKIDTENEYILFCRKTDFDNIPIVPGWKKVIANIPHYSFSEQTNLVQIFLKENLDLLHVPHFNVPIVYPKAFVVTIHDLLWHRSRSLNASNLPSPIYAAKYLAYRVVVKNAVSRAKRIFVPTKNVAGDVGKRFPKAKTKIIVTYEGVSQATKSLSKIPSKYKVKKPYILYVGNLYPHKNVEKLALAAKSVGINLVVVCARSIFWERLNVFIKRNDLEKIVNMVGFIPEKELPSFYKNAEAFVFPTTSEGFGLPGLEAMAHEVPTIASDIPVLREVYGDAAVFFNPKDVHDIAEKIAKVTGDKKLQKKLIEKGRKKIGEYSWRKMAKRTRSGYKEALHQKAP